MPRHKAKTQSWGLGRGGEITHKETTSDSDIRVGRKESNYD